MNITNTSSLAKFDSTLSYILASYPKWQDMDFSKDCKIYGEWLTAYATIYRGNKTTILGPNMGLTSHFVHMALPDNFTLPRSSSVSPVGYRDQTLLETELNAWFVENMREYKADGTITYNKDFLHHVLIDPMGKCRAEYCQGIGLLGNADMTGIGVMVTYYIGAGLATAYLIAFTIERYKQEARRQSASRQRGPLPVATFGHTASKRLLEAFHGSFFGYITAAMMLCVSILAAGIYVAIAKLKENMKPEETREMFFGSANLYDISLAMASCVFSIFPILVGYCFMRAPEQGQGANHKIWLRRAVLFIIWILISLVLFLSPRAERDYADRKFKLDNMNDLERKEYESTYICDQRGGEVYWRIIKALQFLVVGLPVFWFVASIFVFTGFAIPRLRNSATIYRLGKIWHLLPAYLSLVLMWASLGFLQWYRQRIRNNSGKMGEESTWGFGQILALFVWIPTITEFLYILIWGLQDNLQSHMPPNLQVTIKRRTFGFRPGPMRNDSKTTETEYNGPLEFCEGGGYKIPIASSRAMNLYDPRAYSAPVTPAQANSVTQVAVADGFYAQNVAGKSWQMGQPETGCDDARMHACC